MTKYNFFHNHQTVYQNKTVTEKRAPTDESVRLLKEMEEAARNKITESTTVANTQFTCKLHKYYDAMNCAEMFAVIYTLNGKQGRVEVSVETYQELSPTQVACLIRDKVAIDIANEMLSTAFMNEKQWDFFKVGA